MRKLFIFLIVNLLRKALLKKKIKELKYALEKGFYRNILFFFLYIVLAAF